AHYLVLRLTQRLTSPLERLRQAFLLCSRDCCPSLNGSSLKLLIRRTTDWEQLFVCHYVNKRRSPLFQQAAIAACRQQRRAFQSDKRTPEISTRHITLHVETFSA